MAKAVSYHASEIRNDTRTTNPTFLSCRNRRLRQSQKPLRVLVLNLTYFNLERREFYFPANLSHLVHTLAAHGLTPRRVALLFDDIFDTYFRLAGLGEEHFEAVPEVFEYQKRLFEFAVERLKSEPGRSLTDPYQRFLLILEWTITVLSVILSWRKAETLYCENLAVQLRSGGDPVSFLPFAVKQPVSVLARWLANPNTPSVYLSHNISEFRRNHNDGEEWSAQVGEINRIPHLLDDVAVIMPTAIDEYRFCKLQYDTGGGCFLPSLADRWPVMDDVLYGGAPPGAPNYSYLFHQLGIPESGELSDWMSCRWDRFESEMVDDPYVSGLLRSLVDQIIEQVALRDHLLVAHCDKICVYRPYQRPTLSGGVDAEVEHWKWLRSGRSRTGIAFLHSKSEIGRACSMDPVWREGVEQQTVRQRTPESSALRGGTLDTQVRTEEKERWVATKMEPYVYGRPGVASFVFDDEDLIGNPVPDVALQFLRSTDPAAERNWSTEDAVSFWDMTAGDIEQGQ